ncbi:MAG: type II toxin-antitoxin system HicA family toxin [Nitrospinota bacterium]
MSRKEKLIKRLLGRPKDLTWEELTALLKSLGYRESKKAKTGGSRRRFTHESKPSINLHKPHPKNIVKMYVIREVIEFLEREELL